ncbi:secreted protein, partial [Candidatus Magnetomorum sp. HK-1]
MNRIFLSIGLRRLAILISITILLANIIACSNNNNDESNSVSTASTVTIQGYVVDSPVKSANVFIYNPDDDQLLGTAITDDKGFYQISVEPLDSYIVKAKEGLMNDLPFFGEMFAICQNDSVDHCHVTPMTTLSENIAHLFQGDSLDEQHSKSINHLSDSLNINMISDPFIQNMNAEIVEDVNLSEIQGQLGQGEGLNDWVELIQSDIVDGFADDIVTTSC